MKKRRTAERCSQNNFSDNVIYQRHLFAYEQANAFISGKIAEIGCGECYGMQLLLPNVELYVAMDKHLTHIASTQTEKVFFKQMNFPDFSGIPNFFFDFIICFQVIEHIQNDHLFVEKITQLLKPNGKLILTTPHAPMSLTRNPFHVREYQYSEIETLLKPYFDNVEIKGIFGKQIAMEYYKENKLSVERFRKFDIFNFENRLPVSLLKIPYNILNCWNRYKLMKNSPQTISIATDEYYLDTFAPLAFDFFIIAQK